MSNSILVHNKEEDQRSLSHDVIKSLVWNGFFLGLLVALYFINEANGLVDQVFAQLVKF